MFKRTLIVLIIVTLLSEGGILAFAESYAADKDKHCFTAGFWHALWPDWIGCVIAAHETLASGLIASAVAFFAAYTVWRKMKDAQTRRDERDQRLDDRDQRREEREQRRERLEKGNIQRVVAYYSRLLEPFEASETDNINYVDVLNRAFTSGNFSRVPFGFMPAEYRFDASDVWERLKALNKAQKSGTGGEPDTNDINNEKIQTVLMDIRAYRNNAQEDLDSREAAAKQY